MDERLERIVMDVLNKLGERHTSLELSKGALIIPSPRQSTSTMKPYGVKRKDHGCCPGHDKFPLDTYRNCKSKKARARDKQTAHGIARAQEHAAITESLDSV